MISDHGKTLQHNHNYAGYIKNCVFKVRVSKLRTVTSTFFHAGPNLDGFLATIITKMFGFGLAS
jgi:hypothetical protein